jgi:hypothetical protein
MTPGTWEWMGKGIAEASAAILDEEECHRRPRPLPLPD